MNNPLTHKNYTKDDLFSLFIEVQKENTKYMGQVATALDSINDNNVLHSKAINDNASATMEMVRVFNRFFNGYFKVMFFAFILIIAALIVIAGAEKAFDIFKYFKI